MKFIELFGGIGGFRVGLEQANPKFKAVWYNDFDKYAVQTYNERFNTDYEATDIRTVNTKDIPDHELLTGGFPCQSFSIAGKREGFNDIRGTLFFEIARILKIKRPEHLLLENVKGLLNHDKGKTFTVILQTLQELGYDVEWGVVNSRYFGVPQNRERVFIKGSLAGKSRRKIFPIRVNAGKIQEVPREEVARCLDSNMHKGVDPKGFYDKGRRNLVTVQALRNLNRNGRLNHSDDYVGSLQTSGNEEGVWILRDGRDNRSCLRSGRVTELGIKGVSLRRLTPVECERLQGFPDNWTRGVSDTQRYKQLGNAVTVNVIKALGERL